MTPDQHKKIVEKILSQKQRGADGMTYEEYEKAVYQECLKDAITETYPEEFEKIFEEMKPRTREHYEHGSYPDDVAWGICLLI